MRRIRTWTIATVLALIASFIGIFLYLLPQQTLPDTNRVRDFVFVNEAMLWVDDNDFLHKFVRFPNRHEANPHLKLITIDEESIGKIGQFPWNRALYGQLLAKLARAGAKTVAFDVLFVENSRAPGADTTFASGMRRVPTILAYEINTTTGGKIGSVQVSSDLSKAMAAAGYTTVDSAGGWTLHQPFPIVTTDEKGKTETLLPLSAATVRKYTGWPVNAIDAWRAKVGNTVVPLDGDSSLLMLPFKTREYQDISVRVGAPEQHISFAEMMPFYEALSLPDRDLKQFANGNIVLIGTTSQGLGDFVLTPNGRYPGVFSNLRFMDQLLTNTFIRRSPVWLNVALLLLVPLSIAAMVTWLPAIVGVLASLAVVAAYSALVVLAYGFSLYWIDLLHVDAAAFTTALFVALYRVVTEGADKRAIRDMFGKHVSPEIVAEMLKHDDPKAALNLQGKRVKVTIFYSDIRGFTAMSEKMTPEQIYAQLNEYFEDMCQIVFKYGGYVDKFIGDCLMAVFSAPNPKPDDAKNAVFAAIEQQEKILQIEQAWKALGKQTFTVGMGINTGEVVMGNLGSADRLNYTVIGDNVNTAARLYNVAKGGQTIISETTYDEVKDLVVVNELDPVMVKGKEKPLRIFEVIRRLLPNEQNPSKLRDPNAPVTVQMAAAH